MPKQKTRKSVAKRFRVTASGKVMRRGSAVRHLRVNKSKRRVRRQKVAQQVPGRWAKKLKKIL